MLMDKDAYAVSVGQSHTLVIRDNGELWAWGANARGNLGDGTTYTRFMASHFAAPGTGIRPGSEFSEENLRTRGYTNAQIQHMLEREVFRLVNEMRVNYNLSPLIWNNSLATASRNHSRDRAVDPTTGITVSRDAHFGTNGSRPGDRARLAGWTGGGISENMAFGFVPLEQVNAWMNSEGHRANMLSTSATHAGVGFHQHHFTDASGNPDQRQTYTIKFGR
jgi:uncharacterized protein YkwD